MVHYQRYCYQQLNKGGSFANLIRYTNYEEEDSLSYLGNYYYYYYNKAFRPPQLMSFIFLILICCLLIWAPHSSTLPLFWSLGTENDQMSSNISPCSSISNGTICCDRTSARTDICYMKGDIRTRPASSSISLYLNEDESEQKRDLQIEKIRPYTRKWETGLMSTIDELTLVTNSKKSHQICDVSHDIPAVFFSTGGYTGNLYHEFNDGIIPLYITSQHFHKEVVFVILEFHIWWLTKYGDILSQLTNYPPIIFNEDLRSHCFPEAIVGMSIHDELTIDQSRMQDEKSIRDFRRLLDRTYLPRITGLIQDEERERQVRIQKIFQHKPKLVILSRNGSRAITNEDMLAKVAQRIGFSVQVVKPTRTTELAKIYRELNSSDVMVGVHGAAMTHFMFLNPGCVFIQVVPLGTDWAAQTYYGGPAVKLGLKYVGYKILPRESSLYNDYDKDDIVLRDPERVNDKGWEYTKRIYLDKQNVRLDLKRFSKRLVRAYDYSVDKTNRASSLQAQRR